MFKKEVQKNSGVDQDGKMVEQTQSPAVCAGQSHVPLLHIRCAVVKAMGLSSVLS